MLQGVAKFLLGPAGSVELICGSLNQSVKRPTKFQKLVKYGIGNSCPKGVGQEFMSELAPIWSDTPGNSCAKTQSVATWTKIAPELCILS